MTEPHLSCLLSIIKTKPRSASCKLKRTKQRNKNIKIVSENNLKHVLRWKLPPTRIKVFQIENLILHPSLIKKILLKNSKIYFSPLSKAYPLKNPISLPSLPFLPLPFPVPSLYIKPYISPIPFPFQSLVSQKALYLSLPFLFHSLSSQKVLYLFLPLHFPVTSLSSLLSKQVSKIS